MNALEERYRNVLRMLPAAYREVWEDDMVATFLETMATNDPDEANYLADFGRPAPSEVASVAVLAARLRLGGVDAAPRAFAWGEAVRVIALVGLLAISVLATVVLTTWLWEAGRIRSLPAPSAQLGAAPLPNTWGAVLNLTGSLWVGAYLALVFGHHRIAQGLAALGVTPFLAGALWSTAGLLLGGDPGPGHLLSAWCAVLVNLVVVGTLVAFHRDAPTLPPRPWLVAGAVGAGLVPFIAALGVIQPFDFSGTLLDWTGLASMAVVAAIVVHAMRGPTLPWSLAMSLLAGGIAALRIVTLLDYVWHGPFSWESSAVALGLVQEVAVLGAGWWATAFALRALRSLPQPTPAWRTRDI